MVLVTEPKPNGPEPCSQGHGVVHGSTARTTVSKSTAWIWVCPLNMILLFLGLHWGLTVSYLDPIAPMKALLSLDRFQIVLGGI